MRSADQTVFYTPHVSSTFTKMLHRLGPLKAGIFLHLLASLPPHLTWTTSSDPTMAYPQLHYVLANPGVRYGVESLQTGWAHQMVRGDPPSSHWANNAYVESITHGKARSGPKHEYLVVDICYMRGNRVERTTYLFERTVRAEVANLGVVSKSSPSKPEVMAADLATCLYPDARRGMLIESGKSLEGRKVVFGPGALRFHEFLDIALAVTRSATAYELTTTMCYWWADRVFVIAEDLGAGQPATVPGQHGGDRPKLGEYNGLHMLVSSPFASSAPTPESLVRTLRAQEPWGVSPLLCPPATSLTLVSHS